MIIKLHDDNMQMIESVPRHLDFLKSHVIVAINICPLVGIQFRTHVVKYFFMLSLNSRIGPYIAVTGEVYYRCQKFASVSGFDPF